MRIAISGAHFSGKSTLIATILKQFPNYTLVEEPYILLEEQGYEFSNPPSVEDLERQLEFVALAPPPITKGSEFSEPFVIGGGETHSELLIGRDLSQPPSF